MSDTLQQTGFSEHPMIDLGQRTVALTADLLFEPGDRLGTAVFEGYRETHSDDWHSQRSTGYGGSDIAAVVGCSKYTTPWQLWAERTGLVPREDDGKNVDAKVWGSFLEPRILQFFQQKHPGLLVIVAPDGFDMSWRSTVNELQLASPDAIVVDLTTLEFSIAESKTARWDYDWRNKDGALEPPAYYRTQGQHYLDVFGWLLCTFTVLFSGSDYAEIPMFADPDEQRINRNELVRFHELVATKVPPKFTGTDAEVTQARRLHDEVDGTDYDLGPDGVELQAAYVEFDAAESRLNRAKATALNAMGYAKRGVIGRGKDAVHVVSRQGRKGSSPWLVRPRGDK